MSDLTSLSHMREPMAALQRIIDRFDQQGVIIGGVAASILGKPRLTFDLDAMLFASVEKIPEILIIAEAEGIIPRIKDGQEFARKNRVLLLKHVGSGINIDISLGILPFELDIIERSILVKINGFSVRLPTVEDLIILKAVAHRPQDILDLQSMVEANQKIDKARIMEWTKQFSEILESPEIYQIIKRIFHDQL